MFVLVPGAGAGADPGAIPDMTSSKRHRFPDLRGNFKEKEKERVRVICYQGMVLRNLINVVAIVPALQERTARSHLKQW